MRGGACWTMSSTCVQSGGMPHTLGGYQATMMLEPRSPAPAWHLHSIVPKQELPEVDQRNDSGVASSYNSASEFTSSPGSENSHDSAQHLPYTPADHSAIPAYYSTPTTGSNPASAPSHTIFNPLTPSRVEPTTSPNHQQNAPLLRREMLYEHQAISKSNTTLTPTSSPNVDDGEDHLRHLQMALEKNGLLSQPLASPKGSEHSMDDSSMKDDDGEEYDEQGIRIPKVNSHGKVKTFKCKQCEFVAITKLDFWEHSRVHIKDDKLLTCPKCPFVTEYKHHLEYHLRNHFGSKPFKCDKCSYSCVNKSMLNSHLKSHSNVYQYRCADCSYATKYCHSLKLHLRKYSHKPAMVLNPDGSPNPLPIIDVYGTRRGPKSRNSKSGDELEPPVPVNQPPMPQHPLFSHFMLQNGGQPQMPLPFPYLLGAFGGMNPLLFPPQQIEQMMQQKMQVMESEESRQQETEDPEDLSAPNSPNSDNALDLTKTETTTNAEISKSRRKGKAFKLDRSAMEEEDASSTEEEDGNDDPERDVPQIIPEVVMKAEAQEVTTINNNKVENYSCQYCDIAFRDIVMYTMHMGYHGYKDPFTCNMCGEQSGDKVSFFLHIARTSHT